MVNCVVGSSMVYKCSSCYVSIISVLNVLSKIQQLFIEVVRMAEQ